MFLDVIYLAIFDSAFSPTAADHLKTMCNDKCSQNAVSELSLDKIANLTRTFNI